MSKFICEQCGRALDRDINGFFCNHQNCRLYLVDQTPKTREEMFDKQKKLGENYD